MNLNKSGLIEINSSQNVELKPYIPRTIKHRIVMSDAEIISYVGTNLVFDIECFKNYFLIAFKHLLTQKIITFEIPFNEQKLSWILHNYICIGFNSIKYDIPLIWLSYYYQNLNQLKKASDDLILQNMWHTELQNKYKFKIHATNNIDILEVAPLRGSLKLYGARLHAERIQDLPFDVHKEITDEQKEIVKHYCFNDLDTTELLFHFMKERLELRQAMSLEYDENLMSKSDAQIAETVLVKEVSHINGSRPKRPIIPLGTSFKYNVPHYLHYQTKVLQDLLSTIKNTTFVVGDTGKVKLPDELKASIRIGNADYRLGIGGLHSSEENVSYKADAGISIVDRDVTSYYPRLTTTLGLFPRSMGPAFLTAYEKIIQSRIRAKEAKRTTEANGKKIVVNGAGGKYSDPFSVLYDPELTIQQNVTGQLDLLLFVEILTLCGMVVISTNTDGIVTLVQKNQEEKYLECVKYWENITGFFTEETRYSAYYARDVNSYFAVKVGAKTIKDIKVKGPYSEVGSQSGTQLDTNPTSQICSDAVKQLLLDGTPIEKTILECKDFTRFITVRQAKSPGAHKNGEYLGKVIRWYYAKNELGTINTVLANSKIADSEGGKPVMDLPPSFPEDINYDWYFAKTKEILYEINYLNRSKQIRFF